jgi:hypothetical protein
MNSIDNNAIKVNRRITETKKIESDNIMENQIILNSILRRKLNSHNTLKTLNSEISNKIKDNIALDIFNNNANTLSSLLSKPNYNGGLKQEIISIKKEENQAKTIEESGNHHNISHNLKDIKNGGISTPIINDNNEKILKINTCTIENSRNYKFYKSTNSLNSPSLMKNHIKNNIKNGIFGKRTNEILFNYIRDKNKRQIEFKKEKNKKIINTFSFKQSNEQSLKNIKIEENSIEKEKEKNNVPEEMKIYKKKAIKIKNNIKGKNQDIKSNGKESKDKNEILLDNYRKRIAKQFLFYFKPYYYNIIKDHFLEFISNIKKVNHFKKESSPKKYTKKINKRNINDKNDNGKFINDLKLVQLNYSNYNYSKKSNHDTENSNNQINSSNSKKIISEKDIFDNIKKMNYFLINTNNINFSTKESLKDKELYRNNIELEKKFVQILQRKKRKKDENNSNSKLPGENNTINNSLYTNKTLKIKNTIFNNSYDKDYRIITTPHSKKFINSNASISIGDMSKEDIKITKKKNIQIKSTPRSQREIDRKIKIITILNHKFNEKYESPPLSRDVPRPQKRDEKKYLFNNSLLIKPRKKNRTIIITRKEKINNINISHYNKHYISKKIKNISTIDKKINIHINYVFFIPPKKKYKIKLETINKSLEKSNNYSYTFIGTENIAKNRNKIYSKKKKLSSIKEEEEKSRCSFSVIQNTKAIDEYNSIISCLIKDVNDYYIIKMKHVFLYKLKVINIIICTKDIINKYILKKIKIKSNNQEIEGNN